jgi:hypothetical protein
MLGDPSKPLKRNTALICYSPENSRVTRLFSNSIRRHAVNYRRVFLLVALLLGAAFLQRTPSVAAGDDGNHIAKN